MFPLQQHKWKSKALSRWLDFDWGLALAVMCFGGEGSRAGVLPTYLGRVGTGDGQFGVWLGARVLSPSVRLILPAECRGLTRSVLVLDTPFTVCLRAAANTGQTPVDKDTRQ